MSTQLRFDTTGLSRAIEAGDANYQLALYANDAEVEIVDSDDPTQTPRILQGKPAIADWIQDMCASTRIKRVHIPEVSVDRLALIEECQNNDGDFLYSGTAEVHGGQITRQRLTRQCPSAPASVPHMPAGNFLG